MSGNTSVEDANQCMKCGFCMYNCPIYKVDHIESHVARGRNVLIKQANEKTIPTDAEYAERLSFAFCADAVRQFVPRGCNRRKSMWRRGQIWSTKRDYHCPSGRFTAGY